MRVEIDYNGKTYVGKETKKLSPKEVEAEFWPDWDNMTKFHLEGENSEIFIFGRQACKEMVFKIIP